uniref:Uncharacterized protein n=1 Tax=Arundo donax TaxID=35708 RepID=A0A0A9FW82_ARUDO
MLCDPMYRCFVLNYCLANMLSGTEAVSRKKGAAASAN